MPQSAPHSAVGCVAIEDIDAKQIVLTLNERTPGNPQWEILAGHLDPLDPANPEGPRESLYDALAREVAEEGGFVIGDPARVVFFGYRKIMNAPGKKDKAGREYAPVEIMPYFYATTNLPLEAHYGEETLGSGTFSIGQIENLAANGRVSPVELLIIRHGLAAALHDLRGVPYGK